MKKDIILFSGYTLYLSLPQYFAIAPELQEFTLVLLHINETYLSPYDNKFIDKEKFSKFFDFFFELTPFNSIQKRNLMYYVRLKNSIFNYLSKINPTAVISCSGIDLISRMLSAWCIKNKKPFIIIQPSFIDIPIRNPHGLKKMAFYFIINKMLQIPRYRKQERYFGNESQKTHLFLWSKYFIEDPKRKNISIVGNPVFDPLFKKFSSKRKIKNTVLICTQPLEILFNDDIIEHINKIHLKAISENPQLTFYIKIHPREPIEKYKEIFDIEKYPNVILTKEHGLYDLFEKSDLQISTSSYTTFEAAAFGIPVITVSPHEKPLFIDHYRGEIDIRVTDINKISDSIEKALSDDYWEQFLERREKYFSKMVYSTDGNSSERAANIIRNLISKK